MRCWLDESDPETSHLRDLPVDASTLAAVQRNPFACLDNLTFDGGGTTLDDLRLLAECGRTLMVDVTRQRRRNPEALARVSRAVGVDIVYGCGRYIAASRPEDDVTSTTATRSSPTSRC
jgi:phosphotriesterase-related protein